MTPEQVFEDIATLLDDSEISAEDAMKICSAICIGICIDSNKPKQIYIQYMSDAWNHFTDTHKTYSKEELKECH
jgi:predicted XRE-type DNA-binding protein